MVFTITVGAKTESGWQRRIQPSLNLACARNEMTKSLCHPYGRETSQPSRGNWMAFSGMEWVLVLLIVVVLFFGGAKKIPQFAQSLGRARGEYERGKIEVERELVGERARSHADTRGVCPNCSAALGPDNAFCPKCGRAVKPLGSPRVA